MIGIVWYRTGNERKAKEQLKKIIEQYKIMKVWPDSYSETSANFKNYDYWCIKPAADQYSRGCKCDVSYIDAEIPKETINDIIKPCTHGRYFAAFNVY